MLVSSSSRGVAVFRVAVAVGPSAELLDYPGRQPYRGVVEAEAQRLRLGALDMEVAALVLEPAAGQAYELLLGVRQWWVGCAAKGGNAGHQVQVDTCH